jgi:DNA mismatch repair ATPase MutS
MEYIFIVLIVIFIIVILCMWNEKELTKKQKIRLKEEWGKIPQEEYTTEKFASLKVFYESIRDEKLDIDDITWNDLDMNDIYMLINNTQCSIGEEYLYACLRKPCFSNEELKERNRLISFFGANEDKRILLQSELKKIGKLSEISIYKYINRLDQQEVKSNVPHYLMALGLLLSIGLIFIIPGLGAGFTLFFVAYNIYRYYKRKAEIEIYLSVFAYILRMLDSVTSIENLNITELKSYIDTLKQDTNTFKRFKRGSSLLTSRNVSGNLFDALVDYLRMLFHIDLIKYNSMLNFVKRNRKILNRIFTNIGFLDSMTAAASFREMLEYYCEPELIKNQIPSISVVDLYHPLLEEPVANSISEHRSILITGSNASGKSTFIKTLAINAILSQTIFTSLSRNYCASYFMIYSSIALRDNILSKESYYIVEIKSLKRIIDRVNNDIPILCFIDEVLRGTNTLERIAASSRILSSLARKKTMVVAATHDIELTHILEKFYSNYHFQERISNNKIIFDYKLHSGRAVSKNAIRLLGMLGYSKDIIEDAERSADEFVSTGEWSKVNV